MLLLAGIAGSKAECRKSQAGTCSQAERQRFLVGIGSLDMLLLQAAGTGILGMLPLAGIRGAVRS